MSFVSLLIYYFLFLLRFVFSAGYITFWTFCIIQLSRPNKMNIPTHPEPKILEPSKI